MTVNTTRKMHVPAYEPVLVGAQADEYSGVLLEPKNTMSIMDIDMWLDDVDEELLE